MNIDIDNGVVSVCTVVNQVIGNVFEQISEPRLIRRR